MINSKLLMRRLCLYLTVGIALLMVSVGCDEEETRQQIGSSTDVIVGELSREWNVASDWESRLWGGDSQSVLYSCTFQEFIDSLLGQPLVALASLDDVYKTDSGYTARFSSFLSRSVIECYWELECTEAQKQLLCGTTPEPLMGGFAIVALPRRANKFRYKMSAYSDYGTEEPLLFLEPSDAFFVRGTLVDFAVVDNVYQ